MLVVDGKAIPIEDIIDPECMGLYRDEYRVAYGHLALVKNNLFILDQIVGFPFELLTNESVRDFWILAYKAFFDETILALWVLISEEDKGNKGQFAIDNFVKRVMRKYLRKDIAPHLKEQLEDQVKNVDFENRIRELKRKISDVRNYHVAHLDYDTQVGFKVDKLVYYEMTNAEMLDALNIAHNLFMAVSFEGNPELEYNQYSSKARIPSDIDDLLTFVASQHFLLCDFKNKPRMLARQEQRIGALSEKDRVQFDKWKEKVASLRRRMD